MGCFENFFPMALKWYEVKILKFFLMCSEGLKLMIFSDFWADASLGGSVEKHEVRLSLFGSPGGHGSRELSPVVRI